MSDEDKKTIDTGDLTQEELKRDTVDPPEPDRQQGDEFTQQQQPEGGVNLPLSQVLTAMITVTLFGGGLRNPADGSPLTPEQLANTFQQQSAMILNAIGFDDALEQIAPGAGGDVNPWYVVGGGVAATVGLGLLLRPNKKPRKTMPTTGRTPDEKAEGVDTQ